MNPYPIQNKLTIEDGIVYVQYYPGNTYYVRIFDKIENYITVKTGLVGIGKNHYYGFAQRKATPAEIKYFDYYTSNYNHGDYAPPYRQRTILNIFGLSSGVYPLPDTQ